MKAKTQFNTYLPLHKQVRALRRQVEHTQLEVATRAGISQSQYSLFEQGYVKLSSDVVQQILAFLYESYGEALINE